MDFQISGRHNGGHSESRGRGAKRLQSFWAKQKKGLKSMDDIHGAIENGDLITVDLPIENGDFP